MYIHRLEPGPMPSLETSFHLFLLVHRRAHLCISFSHYGRSGGVLSGIVGKGVRGLVVSPRVPVEFIVWNNLLPPLPSLYIQPCVSWKPESPPPYNRGNFECQSYLACSNFPSLVFGCSGDFAIDALAHDTR